MELEKYEVLIDVLQTQNLTISASRFGYSPSGISKLLTNLEKECGFQLLNRKKDSITPTQELLILLPSINDFIQAGKKCRDNIQSIHTNKKITVRIGLAHYNLIKLYSNINSQLRKEYPTINFEIKFDASSSLAEMIENNQLDIAIITKREGSFNWVPLYQDEEVAVIPKGHALSGCKSVPLTVFETENVIVPIFKRETDFNRIFDQYSIKPNIILTTSDDFTAYNMLQENNAISINAKKSAQLFENETVCVSLEPKQSLEIGIIYNKEKPIINEIIHNLKTYFNK